MKSELDMYDRYETTLLNLFEVIAFAMIFVSHCDFLRPHRMLWFWGHPAVSFFLMLSGYFAIYTKKYCTKESVLSYVKRKVGKIYPIHLFAFCLSLPFTFEKVMDGELSIKAVIVQSFATLTMTQSFVPIFDIIKSGNGVAWYLSPWILCVVLTIPLSKRLSMSKMIHRKTSSWAGLAICFGIEILLAFCFRERQGIDNVTAAVYTYYLAFARVLDFVAGMLIGFAHRDSPEKKSFSIFWCGGAVVYFLLWTIALPYTASIHSVTWFPMSVFFIYGYGNYRISNDKYIKKLHSINFEVFLLHAIIIRYMSRLYFPNSIIVGWIYAFVLLIGTYMVSFLLIFFSVKIKVFCKMLKNTVL